MTEIGSGVVYTNTVSLISVCTVHIHLAGSIDMLMTIGHVEDILTMQFSLEFPEILSQNLICFHLLSVSGNSEIIHCGILFNMPYLAARLAVSATYMYF